MHLSPDDISTLIAALDALSLSEYAAEYERAAPLLGRLKREQRRRDALVAQAAAIKH